jgi:sulfur relay (sulfurtransferase) DsrF/TusC family protein
MQAEAEETVFFITDAVRVLCKILDTDPETMQYPAYNIT